jgi:NAD(P)-dependent dehydrogenase (short-subunit alcohol dehydrogenase family)
VTGASSGIGEAIAHRLASEGAQLFLVAAPSDRDRLDQVAAKCAEQSPGVQSRLFDVSEDTAGAKCVAEALELFSQVDLLVCNAGIAAYEAAPDWSLDVFDRLNRVNVRGTYLFARAAARAMIERGGGSMVFTASVSGFLGDEGMTVYNATKAAIAALARSFAVDLAPSGIRVNAVAPGWVRTPATSFIIDADTREWARQLSRIPMARAADPPEIAAVVAFLLSDEASYMTGATVVVDGGQSAGLRGDHADDAGRGSQ